MRYFYLKVPKTELKGKNKALFESLLQRDFKDYDHLCSFCEVTMTVFDEIELLLLEDIERINNSCDFKYINHYNLYLVKVDK